MGQTRRRNIESPRKKVPKVFETGTSSSTSTRSTSSSSHASDDPGGGCTGNRLEHAADEGNTASETHKPKNYQSTLFSQCKTVIKYLLLVILVPPFLNYASLQREAVQLRPKVGELYDIGWGQKLFLSCMGNGLPTVILDAPTGMSSDVWLLVQQKVSLYTKVCVYDRAGLGFSERPVSVRNHSSNSNEDDDEANAELGNRWMEFTVERMADDLNRLITISSQQPKPFILVGSELGGLIARFYTQLHESDVSDVIIVDPLVENLFTQDSGVWSQFWFGHLLPSFQSMQLAAATGLTRIALLFHLIEQPISGKLIPEEVIQRQKHLLCHPRHLSSVVDEHHFINDTFSQINLLSRVRSFPSNISVTVITGNYYDEQLPSILNKAWAKSNQHLISTILPSSKHIVVNGADHHMLYRMPDTISEPIIRTVKQYRSSKVRSKHMK